MDDNDDAEEEEEENECPWQLAHEAFSRKHGIRTGHTRPLRRLLMARLRPVRVQVLLGLGRDRDRILPFVCLGHC